MRKKDRRLVKMFTIGKDQAGKTYTDCKGNTLVVHTDGSVRHPRRSIRDQTTLAFRGWVGQFPEHYAWSDFARCRAWAGFKATLKRENAQEFQDAWTLLADLRNQGKPQIFEDYGDPS